MDKTSISFVPSFSFCGDGAGGSRVSFVGSPISSNLRVSTRATTPKVAVRGIRSGRGTHVEPLIRWMVFVVDVHRRFAAQVHGHLELTMATTYRALVSSRMSSTPRSLTPLSVTLPAGFGRCGDEPDIARADRVWGISRKGPSLDARAVGQVWPGAHRSPQQPTRRFFTKLQPTARSDIFEWQSCARPRAPRTTGEDRNEW